MRERGTPFAGLLYIGLALTVARARASSSSTPGSATRRPRSCWPCSTAPLGGLLRGRRDGPVAGMPPLRWRAGAAVTVVIAAAGYPGHAATGDVIIGAEQDGVIHAGTRRRDDGAIVSTGGRVLSATATGPTSPRPAPRAYALVATITLPGGQHRTDIALRAERGEITV